MVIDRLGAEREPPLAAEQRPGAVGLRPRLAERGASGGAGAATSATRHEDEHDVVADGKIGHALAECFDDARRLVPERHRHRARPRAVDDRKIGMAEPGRLDANENLAAAGRREIEFHDLERPRACVGRRKADRVEDGGFDAHGLSRKADGCARC